MRRGQSEVAKPPQEYRCCNACGAAATDLVKQITQGQEVWLCPHPVACRIRAQGKGIWCTYEPAVA